MDGNPDLMVLSSLLCARLKVVVHQGHTGASSRGIFRDLAGLRLDGLEIAHFVDAKAAQSRLDVGAGGVALPGEATLLARGQAELDNADGSFLLVVGQFAWPPGGGASNPSLRSRRWPWWDGCRGWWSR